MSRLAARLAADGFAFANGDEMRAVFGPLSDWPHFAASWNDLGLDTYMADGGRYRKRRHAAFGAPVGEPIHRKAHQPHYQSREYNTLQGGIERWFEPITTGDGPSLHAILRLSHCVFSALAPAVRRWRIETHQFRIEARADEPGQPTPEGVHRDGVDYVLVLLIDRHNIVSGTTTVLRLNGDELGAFTLTDPLDAALLDDARVAHGVTAIEPLDGARPAWRDVLVVTWRQQTMDAIESP